jgi:hypothetical protein
MSTPEINDPAPAMEHAPPALMNPGVANSRSLPAERVMNSTSVADLSIPWVRPAEMYAKRDLVTRQLQ